MVSKKLVLLYSSTALVCMIYGLMTPFLPLMAEQKSLGVWQVSFIFAAFPFTGIVLSPFVGTFLYKFGRKNSLCIAYVLITIGFSASGASEWLSSDWFFAANVFSRVTTGAANVFLFTVVITIISSDYPESVFEYIRINESMVGLGFLLGPLAGAGLYMALGFAGAFFAAAGFYFLAGIAVFLSLGKDRKYVLSHQDEHILRLGTRPRILVTMLPLVFGTTAMGAQNVFIATHLKHNGLSTGWITACFGITGVGYFLTTFVLAKKIGNCNKKVFNSIGCAVSVASMVLVGPWPEGVRENVGVILAGFALMPLGLGVLFVELMPSLIEVATVDLEMQNDDKLSDKLSGTVYLALTNFGSSFGELTGPLLLGGIVPALGLRNTCGCIAGLGVAVLCIYIAVFLFSPKRKGIPLIEPKEVPLAS